MAFGFTPKFEQSLDLNGLDPDHYLVIALDAAKQLNWSVTNISKTGFTAFTGFSMRSWNEEVTIVVDSEQVQLTSKCLGSQMVDWGKNKENIEKFIEEYERLQSSLDDDTAAEKVTAFNNEIESGSTDDNETPATSLARNKSFLSFFIPKEGYYITPIIIDINILVFILMVISGVSLFKPSTDSLIAWGANLRALTLEGQWWRLFTNVFLHIGILHILLNMYALIYIGLLLEPYLGKLRFASAYLFTGILASLTSIYWHPFTISAGASGAIFGMYGVFLAMLTTNIIDKKTRSALFASIGVFVVFNLVNGVKAGIDNAAHIGGLASGLIIGYAFYPSLRKPDALDIRYLTIGLLFIATFATSFVVYHKIPNDIAKYDEKIKEFSQREEVALELFKMKNSSDDQILSAIKDKGIVNWDANLKILGEMGNLDVPDELKYRVSLLRHYCNLRIVSYNLIYKAVEEKTQKYKPAIDSCNTKIQATIDSLKQ